LELTEGDIKMFFFNHKEANKLLNLKLDAILKKLAQIQEKEEHMSKELDDLEVAVTENTTLDGSIVELVSGLAAQIEALKTDPVKLQALATSLRTSSAAISAAIQANVLPEPPPVG
jgi:seryl-tRNA(Sec) selenium transferase